MANVVDVDLSIILAGGFKDATGNPRATLRKTITKAFDSNSVNASLVNQVYGPIERTLAPAANETLDLTDNLLNPINLEIVGAAAFTKVRAIAIEHVTTSEASAIVVGNGTNPFGAVLTTNTATFTLAPGQGVVMWDRFTVAGMTVDGTHKTVKVANSDGSNEATYQVWIIGSVAP